MNPATDPILSADDLAQLSAECDQACPTLADALISLKQRLGPYASPYLGSGFEYQESRPYQPGDPLKQLNWRYFARSGELFTRLYEQERQARLLLVVDQRQVMRFGTRVRLKVQQAVRLALGLVRLATAEGMAVQLLPLADHGALSPMLQGRTALDQAEALLNQPCPPGEPTPDNWDAVRLPVEQLPAGSLIVLIGDLMDLEANTARWLTEQAPYKATAAVWVQDQAEWQVPLGRYELHDLQGQAGARVDAARAQAYAAWAQERFASRQRQLAEQGLLLYRLWTHARLSEFEVLSDG